MTRLGLSGGATRSVGYQKIAELRQGRGLKKFRKFDLCGVADLLISLWAGAFAGLCLYDTSLSKLCNQVGHPDARTNVR